MIEFDVPVVAELYTQLGYPTDSEIFRSRFLGLQDNDDHAVFVVELDSAKVVGVIHVRRDVCLHLSSTAEIAALVVESGCRGNGLGQILMEAAESWAISRGLKDIRLLSNVVREEAHTFYRNRAYSCSKSAHLFVKSFARGD